MLVVMAVAIVAILAVSWKFNIRIYSKAQVALREVFADGQSLLNLLSFHRVQSVLNEAHMADILITPQSPAANKIIREINLRAVTGAAIIALERGGDMHVNPSAGEILRPGDRLYLLGTSAQLEKGRAILGW
jgi:CPA2 family monovalent cation:H+ antiporter-2